MEKKIEKNIYNDISYFGNDISKDFLMNYNTISNDDDYYNKIYDKKGDKIKSIVEKIIKFKKYPNPILEEKFKDFIKELDIYFTYKKELKILKSNNRRNNSNTSEIDKVFFNQTSDDNIIMDDYIEKKKISLY
jgi:hypothetical protein